MAKRKTRRPGDFLPGNQFWKARSSHGRKPVFESPEPLWEACCEYFDWVEAHPLWEDQLVTYQGVSKHEPVAKMRAMTVEGLCIFLDITSRTFRNYRDRPDFADVVERVNEIIRVQKFEGGAAELLNPNIVMRDLGLMEKSQTTHEAGDSLTALLKAIDGRTRGIPTGS